MRGKWLLISVAAVLAGAGAAALSVRWKGHPAMPARPSAAALIPATPEITLPGKLRPQHITTVAANTDGNIDEFLVDVGDDVFAGEVLARVGASGLADQRDAAAAAVNKAQEAESKAEALAASARMESSRADADRQRARTELDRIRAIYERQQMLNQHGATPRLTWEKAQHDFAAAQQEYDAMQKAASLSAAQLQSALDGQAAAQKMLAERNQEAGAIGDGAQSGEVVAPVDGTVVARNGEVGSPAGASLFEIATDMFALEVTVEPEPAMLPRLHPGDAALILFPDLQSAGVEGRVREIQANTAIVEFNCTLAGVRPGMPVQVRLKLQ